MCARDTIGQTDTTVSAGDSLLLLLPTKDHLQTIVFFFYFHLLRRYFNDVNPSRRCSLYIYKQNHGDANDDGSLRRSLCGLASSSSRRAGRPVFIVSIWWFPVRDWGPPAAARALYGYISKRRRWRVLRSLDRQVVVSVKNNVDGEN